MKMLGFLLQKEFIQIFRDKTILLLLFLITTILLFILPRAAKIQTGEIRLSVVDHDRSTASNDFLKKLTGTNQFLIGVYANTYDEALQAMENNKTGGILEIPRGFEKNLLIGEKASLMLEIDAVNGVLAGLTSFYFMQTLQQYLWEYIDAIGYQPGFVLESQEELMAKAQAAEQRPSGVDIPLIEKPQDAPFEQIDIKVNGRYNPGGESRLYQLSALIAVLVCLVGTVLATLNIVTEKESGTIEQMNVSPVRKSLFILSKIIPSWIIGLAILTLSLIIVWALYGVVPLSSYLSIYVVSFLFLVAMVGFGVLISTACKNQQQAMLLCFFFLLIICLLCGMWSPIGSMPVWAKIIADINPLRYYVEAIRLFFAYGSSLRDVLPHMGMLCVFIVIFNGWAIWNFRKAG